MVIILNSNWKPVKQIGDCATGCGHNNWVGAGAASDVGPVDALVDMAEEPVGGDQVAPAGPVAGGEQVGGAPVGDAGAVARPVSLSQGEGGEVELQPGAECLRYGGCRSPGLRQAVSSSLRAACGLFELGGQQRQGVVRRRRVLTAMQKARRPAALASTMKLVAELAGQNGDPNIVQTPGFIAYVLQVYPLEVELQIAAGVRKGQVNAISGIAAPIRVVAEGVDLRCPVLHHIVCTGRR